MQALLALSRVIDRLNALIGKYAIWLIFLLPRSSAPSTPSFARPSTTAPMAFGGAVVSVCVVVSDRCRLHPLNREHVRIDVLNAHFSKRAQIWIEILG